MHLAPLFSVSRHAFRAALSLWFCIFNCQNNHSSEIDHTHSVPGTQFRHKHLPLTSERVHRTKRIKKYSH